MARKRTLKRKALPPKEGQKVDLTLVPDHGEPFPSYYGNFAYVSHTNSEIIVDFCLLSLPYNVDIEEKQARVPVKCRIILPPVLIEGLVKALELQQEKQAATAQSQSIAIPIEGAKKR